jgi:DNA-binding NtrC family response regulator
MYVLAAFAQQRDSPARRRVLIVDDHDRPLQPLSTLLVRAGYSADHCRDQRAAFEVLASGEHGVLIAEQHLDLQNGVALVRQVQGTYADVSIILLNADGTLAGAVPVLQAGVFDFMTKVFSLSTNPDQLLDTLRRAVQREVVAAAPVRADALEGVSESPPGGGVSLEDAPVESGVRLQVQSLEDMEWSYILRVLDGVGGNKASAARLLGVDRTTLYRKLQRQKQLGALPDAPAVRGPRK